MSSLDKFPLSKALPPDLDLSTPSSPNAEFVRVITSGVAADPLLPRANPTVAFWQEPACPTVGNIQSPVLPHTVDIAVIGSGITSCSVVKSLLEDSSIPNQRVAVIEARSLTSCATGRNGGHLISDGVYEFPRYVAQVGLPEATKVARFSLECVARVREVITSFGVELMEASQLRDVVSVGLIKDSETLSHVKEALAMFNDALPEFKHLYVLTEGEEALKAHNFRDGVAVIENRDASALWPYRLVTGIFETLLKQHSNRLSIDTNTPVTAIAYDAHTADTRYPYVLSTTRGTIRAGKVVHCTNGFASHLLPGLRSKIFPLRGTMSTQKPGPTFPNIGAHRSWAATYQGSYDAKTGIFSSGLYYITQNPQTGDINIGGEVQQLNEMMSSDDSTIGAHTRNNIATVLPTIFRNGWEGTEPEPRRIWSGIMGFTGDGMPLVGNLSAKMTLREGSGEWVAAGFNGYGMDKCWLTGEALAKMIVGTDVSDWFPASYVVSDERLDSRMSLDGILDLFAGL